MDFGLSFLEGGHPVDPNQPEPGLAAEDQADSHHLSAVLMSWNLAASFGLHDRLSLEVSLPMRVNQVSATFGDSHGHDIEGFQSIHHRDEAIVGIGDVGVGVRVGIVNPGDAAGFSLQTTVGATLPTGGTVENPFVRGRSGLEHQHMFFGTGTVMPTVGLQLGYAFSSVSLAGWVESRLGFYENSEGFRPGSRVASGVGAITGFGLTSWRFLLQHEVDWEAASQWGDEPAVNSGRTALLVAAGVFWSPAPPWEIHVLLKAPYYSKSVGDQFDIPFVTSVGVAWGANVL